MNLIEGIFKTLFYSAMSIFQICTKLCGILALPSKTDFKAHTARFGFEGSLTPKEGKSQKVLVLFYLCSNSLELPRSRR